MPGQIVSESAASTATSTIGAVVGNAFYGIQYEYYFLTSVGAFILYLKLKGEKKGMLDVVGHFFPTWLDHPLGRIADALLVSVLGGLVSAVLTHPANAQQALAAGLGWTGFLSKKEQ